MPYRVYGSALVVCGPGPEQIHGLGEAQERWCFGCRKRTRHWRFVVDMPYYDPEPFWKCDTCWESNDEFPR
jgi:hypothetical protein